MKEARFYVLCKLILGSVLWCLGSPALAQQHEIGLGLGGTTYTGDIIRRIDPTQVGIQGTLFGRRNFDNAWSLRAGLSVGRLNGMDYESPIDTMAVVRNAYFRGTLFEAAAVMEFHFLDYLSHTSTTRYSPYGFLGLGYTLFAGDGQAYEGDPESGSYALGTAIVPFGLGIKYKLKERLFLSMEFGFRPTLTDRLDKIADDGEILPRFSPDPDTGNPTFNPHAFNFGNRFDKDWYYFFGVNLSYSFYQVPCYRY